MHAKSDSYTISCRSAALPYPKHGCRLMPAPMRSSCTIDRWYLGRGRGELFFGWPGKVYIYYDIPGMHMFFILLQQRKVGDG